MPCSAEANYDSIIDAVRSGEGKKLGEGTFGSVFKVDNYVVKRISIKTSYDKQAYLNEAKIWEELSSYTPMKSYMPSLCVSRIINDIPPEPILDPSFKNEKTKINAQHAWRRKYGYKDPDTEAFIIQKYEPVKDLATKINEWRSRKLSAEAGYTLIKKLVEGFNIFHKAGYVHRDIKPANILIRDSDLSPLIVDFGMACKIPCTDTDDVVGTPMYAPQNLYNKSNEMRFNNICNFPVASKQQGFFARLTRRLGCGRITAKLARRVSVQLTNNVPTPEYNPSIDKYAISIVLRELVHVISWGYHGDWVIEVENIIHRYRASVLPYLASSIARTRFDTNSFTAVSSGNQTRSSPTVGNIPDKRLNTRAIPQQQQQSRKRRWQNAGTRRAKRTN